MDSAYYPVKTDTGISEPLGVATWTVISTIQLFECSTKQKKAHYCNHGGHIKVVIENGRHTLDIPRAEVHLSDLHIISNPHLRSHGKLTQAGERQREAAGEADWLGRELGLDACPEVIQAIAISIQLSMVGGASRATVELETSRRKSWASYRASLSSPRAPATLTSRRCVWNPSGRNPDVLTLMDL